MKKREVLLTLAAMAVFGLSGCGTKELSLISDQVEVELGAELDQDVTAYVQIDEKEAAEAVVDLSAVDMSKVGTYSASVTYKEQSVSFEVIVTDTTAPVVEIADDVVVAVDTPLTADDVITSITESSGSVDISFADLEMPEESSVDEGTEAIEETEVVEEIEAPEDTELEENEVVEEASEQMELPADEFTLNDVICSNDYLIFSDAGEYDIAITVTDASGNSTEVTVHVLVGEAPEFSGIDDITVNVGADEIDYLEGVTATDYNGNDITDKIVCDSVAVDLENPGEYIISYTVADERGFEATENAIVTVKDKNGRTSTSSTSSSKPDTSGSGSSNASGTTSSTSGSGSSNASGTTSSTSESGNGNASGTTSSTSGSGSSNASGTTSSTSGATSTTTDSSNQASTSTTTTTTTTDTSNQTTTQTPSTDTATTTNPWDAPMTEPDDAIEGDPGLMDNTGTGGTDGGDVIGGGNW